ncbi:MAG: hypothetical protein MRY32_05995 [Rickettsiales bacterium]|nr:hypothetical protein [Rickettsiales bacterium]
MKNIFFLSLAILFTGAYAQAATVSGSIEVMKKGGESALEQHDNAVVFLSGITQPAPSEPAISRQKDKQFEPRILPIVKGQMVHFYNDDPIQHNVFSNNTETSFDLGSFPRGQFREQTFEQSTEYKVYCNIHQSMVQDIIVLDNQLFGTTDASGNFTIKNVPAGNYTLNVIHIYGGKHEQPIQVSADVTVPQIQVTSTKVVRDVLKHKNKLGRRYERKAY